MKIMKNSILTLILGLSVATFVTGCVTEVVDETVQKVSTQDGTGFTALKVSRSSDDIIVTGWNSDTIKATAYLSIWAGNSDKAQQISDDLKFSWATGSPTAELIVTSDESDQELAQLNELKISAPSRFGLNLETSSGDIKATNMLGDLNLTTSSGDVIAETKGRVTANTSGGDVHAVAGRGATLDLSSGDVTLDVTTTEFDGVNVETSSGDVTMRLAEGAKVTFDLNTSSGDITVNYGGTTTSSQSGYLRIDINGGGKIVNLETSSGDIKIQTLR